ncbi:hypothetical protein KNE206_62520 [Kitasatospora sp. NE20-6]|uniref:phosphopantetheine-binding protein n=1 Tax=Kitasatospora sp. NE20-6 TaxID=2859066 RepID=UPI0034DCA84C
MPENPPPPTSLSPDRIRRDVADLLDVDPLELEDDEPLLDQGMDSIRLMTLVERWRADGVEVTFVDLAEKATINGWSDLLGAVRSAGPATGPTRT